MALNPPIDRALDVETPRPRAGWTEEIREFCVRRPLGAIGAAIILLMLLVALLAPLIARYDPVVNDFAAMLAAPSRAHWLGTDAFGRDVLSRLIYGSRTALLVGFGSSVLGATLGAVLGVASAYFGGRVDLYLQRVMDVFLSFPLIILALALVAILGNSIPNLIMLPAFLGQAILLESSLSFLGLGVQEPIAAWGLMLRGAAVEFAEAAPWMAIFPGLAISLSVFAFNLFGDSLRDALDPRLKTQ
jgi:peptide/nickel transport system permease protein